MAGTKDDARCSAPLCTNVHTGAGYCPEHQACGYRVLYDDSGASIYCGKPTAIGRFCFEHRCCTPACPKEKHGGGDYCIQHNTILNPPRLASKRLVRAPSAALPEKRPKAAECDPQEPCRAHYASDERVCTVRDVNRPILGLWCRCGTVTPLAILPKSLPIHADFRCGDCQAESHCLVCNKNTANPFAMPPFETRMQELEMYYCKEHLEAAAPDPHWKKQFLRVPRGAKADEYCHSCGKDFRNNGISVIRGGEYLPQVTLVTPWCRDCVRAAESRWPK